MTDEKLDEIRIVLVGDKVGKTRLGTAFILDDYSTYITQLDALEDKIVKIRGSECRIRLRDTGGGEEYDRLRPLSYHDAHVVLLCFSVDSVDSLDRLISKYISEVRMYLPRVPVVTVACKGDLRDEIVNTIPIEKCEEVAQELCSKYIETSAKNVTAVDKCFSIAIEEAVLYKDRLKRKIPRRSCTVI